MASFNIWTDVVFVVYSEYVVGVSKRVPIDGYRILWRIEWVA